MEWGLLLQCLNYVCNVGCVSFKRTLSNVGNECRMFAYSCKRVLSSMNISYNSQSAANDYEKSH
jgi:hypothetical protein